MIRRPSCKSSHKSVTYLAENPLKWDGDDSGRQTYKAWLLARGGRRMYRAIRKAEDRYAALRRNHCKVSGLRRDYRAKR